MEAVELKCKAEDLEPGIIEIQVFLNDRENSNFDTLFQTLPQDRSYAVAGVPGSFQGKLFPRASMNIMHSSFAHHFLSKVPEEVKMPDTPARNKG